MAGSWCNGRSHLRCLLRELHSLHIKLKSTRTRHTGRSALYSAPSARPSSPAIPSEGPSTPSSATNALTSSPAASTSTQQIFPFQSYIGNVTSSVGRSSTRRPWGLANTRLTYDPPAVTADELKKVTVWEDTPALPSCILQAKQARKLPNLAKVPYLARTGEASPHITYDQCVIDYLRQAGVKADWLKLADVGIKGMGTSSFWKKPTSRSQR
ncbi:hypothetical protein MMC16_003352 [Acarospora aff. strigata]|nr:hypothetical protein [Acarospora aff. strigata]